MKKTTFSASLAVPLENTALGEQTPYNPAKNTLAQ